MSKLNFFPTVSVVLAAVLATGATSFADLARLSRPVNVQACRAPDTYSYNLKAELESAMASTHPFSNVLLTSRGVVRVSASQVVLVTDTAICRRAAAAFGTTMNDANPDRQVHAVRVGIRYAVIDPDFQSTAGWRVGVTFDSSFTQTYIKFAY